MEWALILQLRSQHAAYKPALPVDIVKKNLHTKNEIKAFRRAQTDKHTDATVCITTLDSQVVTTIRQWD